MLTLHWTDVKCEVWANSFGDTLRCGSSKGPLAEPPTERNILAIAKKTRLSGLRWWVVVVGGWFGGLNFAQAGCLPGQPFVLEHFLMLSAPVAVALLLDTRCAAARLVPAIDLVLKLLALGHQEAVAGVEEELREGRVLLCGQLGDDAQGFLHQALPLRRSQAIRLVVDGEEVYPQGIEVASTTLHPGRLAVREGSSQMSNIPEALCARRMSSGHVGQVRYHES